MNDIEVGVNETEVVETAPVNTEVAATPQDSESTQDVQPEAHIEQKTSEQTGETRFEKAFAARLKKEQEKFEAQYSKHKYVIEKAAAENDMSVDEYLAEIEKTYKEKEYASIPKDIRDDVLWAREKRSKEQQELTKAQETEQWNTEVKNLLGTFKDIKTADDIPDEVLEYRLKDNVPLEYAYAKYALGKERTKIEQETLRKLRENQASSVGSMASSSTDTKLRVSDMNDADFEKLIQEVKRGTRKSL